MIFGVTDIDGVRLIDIEAREDARGFFARHWCQMELTAQGLDATIVQRHPSGAVRVVGKFGVLRWVELAWHFEPPVSTWVGGVTAPPFVGERAVDAGERAGVVRQSQRELGPNHYPSTRITTRRFCARPSFVLLSATGFVRP